VVHCFWRAATSCIEIAGSDCRTGQSALCRTRDSNNGNVPYFKNCAFLHFSADVRIARSTGEYPHRMLDTTRVPHYVALEMLQKFEGMAKPCESGHKFGEH